MSPSMQAAGCTRPMRSRLVSALLAILLAGGAVLAATGPAWGQAGAPAPGAARAGSPTGGSASTSASAGPLPAAAHSPAEFQAPAAFQASAIVSRDLTLTEAVLLAVRRGVVLAGSRAELESALVAVSLEKARRYPEIAAVTTAGLDAPDGEFGGRAEAGVTLSATLFDFGATDARIDAAGARVEEQRHALSGAFDQLALSTAETYLEVLSRRQLVTSATWARDRARELYEDARTAVSRRALDKVAAETASVFLTQREYALELAREEVESAEAALAVILGFEPRAMRDPVLDHPPLGTVDEAVARAVANAPSVLAAQSRVLRSQAEFEETRALSRGSVRFEADAAIGRYAGGEDAAVDGSALVRVVIPLFDGGVRSGELMQRRLDLGRAGSAVEVERQAVERRIRAAYTVLDHAAALRLYQQETVAALDSQIRSLPGDIEAQVRTFDAAPQLVGQYADANEALTTAYYLQQMATLRFAAASGDLAIKLNLSQARRDWLSTTAVRLSPFTVWVERIADML